MTNNCEKHERFILEGGCPAVAFEEAQVTVPVTVQAGAEAHEVKLSCNGGPHITYNSDVTPGVPCAVSKFTISQRLLVEIPVVFNAEADIGTAHVKFERHEGDSARCECADSKRMGY